MNDDKTKLEDDLPEPEDHEATILEEGVGKCSGLGLVGRNFEAKEATYQIMEELEARGAEADLYVMQTDGAEGKRVLKYYRKGVHPKTEITEMLSLLMVDRDGFGCRTEFSSFLPVGGKGKDSMPHKHGGYGISAMDTEALVGALAVSQHDQVLLLAKNKPASQFSVHGIRASNRGTKLDKLIDLPPDDFLVGIFRL